AARSTPVWPPDTTRSSEIASDSQHAAIPPAAQRLVQLHDRHQAIAPHLHQQQLRSIQTAFGVDHFEIRRVADFVSPQDSRARLLQRVDLLLLRAQLLVEALP